MGRKESNQTNKQKQEQGLNMKTPQTLGAAINRINNRTTTLEWTAAIGSLN